MKKIILGIIAVIIFGCSSDKTPKDQLKEDAEKALLIKLNDPSSYDFVEFKVDTILREISNQDILTAKILMAKENDELKKQAFQDLIDKTKVYPKNQIEFLLIYRTKNKFNAIELDSSIVISDNDFKLIAIK